MCSGMQPVNVMFLLRRSGWKRSRDGSWVKDENAEFDSDEDAPDI